MIENDNYRYTTNTDKWCYPFGVVIGPATFLSNAGKAVRDAVQLPFAAYRFWSTSDSTIESERVKNAKDFSEVKQALWQHIKFMVIGIIRTIPIIGASISMAYNNYTANVLIKMGDDAKHENDELAISYYRQAIAINGSTEAMLGLGVAYIEKKIDNQPKEGLDWFIRAAKLGNVDALSHLGNCCLFGIGIEKSEKLALEYYKLADALGSLEALTNLGSLYVNLWGIDFSNDQSVRDVQEKECFAKGIECLKRASQSGYSRASYFLGVGYRSGKLGGACKDGKCGLEVSPGLASSYFYQAATAESYIALADLALEGKGYHVVKRIEEPARAFGIPPVLKEVPIEPVKMNPEEEKAAAYHYLYTASLKGSTEAQFKLSDMHEKKLLPQFDEEENANLARDWLQRAADNGHVPAMFKMGCIILQENPESAAFELAFEYIRKSAEAGHIDAQYHLAGLCRRKIRFQQAMEWYEKAARFGHEKANYELYEIYENGLLGMAKSEQLAQIHLKASGYKVVEREVQAPTFTKRLTNLCDRFYELLG